MKSLCENLGRARGGPESPPTELPTLPPRGTRLLILFSHCHQDPTNGYYNVRAHEDRPSSRAVLYAATVPPGPARPATPLLPPLHSSGYAQLNTYSRAPAPGPWP